MNAMLNTNNHIEWKQNIESEEWDRLLAAMNGHPLQSAKWGNARNLVDGIKDNRWAAFVDGKPIYLVRFEERLFLKYLKIAWIPQGPTLFDPSHEPVLHNIFMQQLEKKGYLFCLTNPWKKLTTEINTTPPHYTLWIDLTLSKDQLWKNIHKEFRYGIKRAKKEGVMVKRVNDPNEIKQFYEVCKSISQTKRFQLNTSVALMNSLLRKYSSHQETEANLFAAYYQDVLCAGAFVMRCGNSVHYIWGAMNREFSKQRVSEAIQWEVIEWAKQQNCKIYDLGGVNLQPEDNNYKFKKRLGGELICLSGIRVHPLVSKFGWLTVLLSENNVIKLIKIRRFLKFSFKIVS